MNVEVLNFYQDLNHADISLFQEYTIKYQLTFLYKNIWMFQRIEIQTSL